MKKILIFLICLSLMGCAYNDAMKAADIAKADAYGKGMTAYYENSKQPDKVVDFAIGEDGKLKNIIVYNTAMKSLPPPEAPQDLKPWGVQTMEASRDVLITGLKWGAGLMAIKIVTDNAGHNSSNVNSNNMEANSMDMPVTTNDTSTHITDAYKDSSSSDLSSHVTDSYNTPTTILTDRHDVIDNGIENAYNADDHSQWEDSHDVDRHDIDNQNQFSGDFEAVPEVPEMP